MITTTFTTAEFKSKAEQLQGAELVDAGRQLLSINAPQSLIDVLIEIVFDRNGAEAADQFVDLIFARDGSSKRVSSQSKYGRILI